MDNDLLTMKNFEEYTPLDYAESKKSSVFTGKQHMVNKFFIKYNNLCTPSPGTPVSSINKTDRHDITEILLKVAINTKTLTLYPKVLWLWVLCLLKFIQLLVAGQWFPSGSL